MFTFLYYTIFALVWILPLVVAVVTSTALMSTLGVHGFRELHLLFVPFIYTISFPLTAGLLSRIGLRGVVPGEFDRGVSDPLYKYRRLHSVCWTSLFYFKPIYFLSLSIPSLRRLVFTLFGNNTAHNFTIYPDVWLRDLPTLSFGKNCYIANRSTVGSNIVTKEGKLIAEGITFEEGSVLGHLGIIALGSKVGKKSQIGSNAALGIRIKIGEEVDIGPRADINHGARLRDKCTIGASTYIGLRAIIGAGVNIPAGSVIPAGTRVKSNDEFIELLDSQKTSIKNHIGNLAKVVNNSFG